MKIDKSQFESLNDQGLIPGPQETEDEFTKRVKYCLNLKDVLAQQCELPAPIDSQTGQALLNHISPFVKKAYDFSPLWTPIVFSNHQLAPWHGGCAWIFQVSQESPLGAFFQLRETFSRSHQYLGIYNRDEIVIHETAHIGRMAFQEPKFEEFLAYRSSKSLFRKWFGPIVESPKEGLYFVIFCFFAFVANLYYLFFDGPDLLNWMFVLPLLLISIGLVRLILRHIQFHRCLVKVEKILRKKETAPYVVYRLSDKEMINFGKMAVEEIKSYIASEMKSSLRWRFIEAIYLKE